MVLGYWTLLFYKRIKSVSTSLSKEIEITDKLKLYIFKNKTTKILKIYMKILENIGKCFGDWKVIPGEDKKIIFYRQ